jgi:hypothetical protein
MKVFNIIVLAFLFTTILSIEAQWSQDPSMNTVISIYTSEAQKLINDGIGGYIVVWEDRRNVNDTKVDIYAQRIDKNGIIKWSNNGVKICNAVGNQLQPQLVSDGKGGAIITWEDLRKTYPNEEIYAQRIDSNGLVKWTENGVSICSATGGKNVPQLVSDNIGGAIITWEDYRSFTDIYAQRINSNGIVQWSVNGVPICQVSSQSFEPRIISDGNSGAIISWYYGNGSLYAQKINNNGNIIWDYNGKLISPNNNMVPSQQFLYDDNGGAYLTFCKNNNNNYDIIIQHIDLNGSLLWGGNGIVLCSAINNQNYPTIIKDGIGNFIVAWRDSRNSSKDSLYAQKINSNGIAQWNTNGINIGCYATSSIISVNNGDAIFLVKGTNTNTLNAQKINTNGIKQWTTDGILISTNYGVYSTSELVHDGVTGAVIALKNGVDYYGNIFIQNTASLLKTVPLLNTVIPSSINITSALSGGNITNDGNASVTARGVCWSTSHNPTIDNSKTTDGSGIGSFTSNITGLIPNTTYYVRAYATNSVGTGYGDEVSFITNKDSSNYKMLSFQGVLRNNQGQAIQSGNYQFTFRIYNLNQGGSALWTETKTITIVNGVVNTDLGDVNKIDLPFDTSYWLGIQVGADSQELSPRRRLTGAIYTNGGFGR